MAVAVPKLVLEAVVVVESVNEVGVEVDVDVAAGGVYE